MGTRINYEIGNIPSAILFSNSSHHTEVPEDIFRELAKNTVGQTQFVRDLLQKKYTSDSGNHRDGEYIFSIDLEPGDREKILRATFDGPGCLAEITETIV